MHLLQTQVDQLLEKIDSSAFDRTDFQIEHGSGYSTVRHAGQPKTLFFLISEHWIAKFSPAADKTENRVAVSSWPQVLQYFTLWLGYLRRELAAQGSEKAGERMPEWVSACLPAVYHETLKQLESLGELERRMKRMGGLLWMTGDPLGKLVRDAFRAMDFSAESTAPGATYDVTVALPQGRLLVEVTGIEGQINKGSKKITQVLNTLQTEAKPGDRVCVAVNAYRDRPLKERASLELMTAEALGLLERLNAVVFTTTDLFRVWELSLADSVEARSVLLQLQSAPPGLSRLLA